MTRESRLHIAAAIIAPIALLFALIAWGVSSPPGSSPDDDYHMASIWCANGPIAGQCEETSSESTRMLPGDLTAAASCFRFQPDQAASCPRHEGEMVVTDRGNWGDGAYPPLFYKAMSVFVGPDLSTSIVVMRTVNSVLFIGTMVGLFVLLPQSQRKVLIWGAAITMVPLGMFLIPSVNPSSWAVISAAGLWIATWGFFSQIGWKKWALAGMAVVLLIMGAGSRSDAAVYGVLALIVASVLSFRLDRRFLVELVLPLVLLVTGVLLFFSTGQSAVVSGETAVAERPLALSTLAFVDLKLLPELWIGVFGFWGLGWLDTELPGIVWVTTTTLFGALVFWGLRVGSVRKWIALAGVAVSLIAIPMYILLHDNVIIGTYVQPRYIYPLVIIFGGVALVGFMANGLGLGRLQLFVVATGLTIANSVALHVNLRRYTTGMDNLNFNLDEPIEWWWNVPITPMMVWFIGSLLFAAGAAALAATSWRSSSAPLNEEVRLRH